MKALSTTLFIAGSLIAVSVSSADIYKSVDENGNVSFGQTKVDGAEKVEIPEPNISESQTAFEQSEGSRTETGQNQSETVIYESLNIVSPEHDKITEGRTGAVQVTFLPTPGLAATDKLIITVNGEDVSKGANTTLALEELTRGAHSVTGRILGVNNEVKIQSNVVTFHVQRPSVLKNPSLALDGNN